MVTGQVEIIPIQENSIFQENIDKAYLYNNQVDVIIGLDIDDIFLRFNDVKLIVKTLDKHCENCDYLDEIENLNFRINQLDNLAQHLKIITHSRHRRGLLNIIGSVSKQLFGTLDNDDLDLINKNIDTLFNDNNKLKTIVSNQTALIRKVINSDGLKQIEKLNFDITHMRQSVDKDRTMTKLIIKSESAIHNLHFQLDELLDVIILGKQGIISPQIINQNVFIQNYAQALGHKALNTAIEPRPENFQFILDTAELSIFTISNRLFFKISIPIILDLKWDIVQVYPIPTLKNNVFMAPLVEHQIYFRNDVHEY